MQYPAYGQVVIGHVRVFVRIAIFGAWTRCMIVGYLHGNKLWHLLFSLQPHVGKVSFKLVHSKLVRYVGIVTGIVVAGAAPQSFLHGHHYRMTGTGGSVVPLFSYMRCFVGFAKIVERYFAALKRLPQAASFCIILRVHTAGRTREPSARCLRKKFGCFVSAWVGFYPFVGYNAHHPMVAMYGGIAIAIKIIAERKFHGHF